VIQLIKGWKEKQLSIGGKEILIKAVAQSISVYAMSVFLIPKEICKIITDIISQFWWGDDDQSKKCTGILGGKCAFQRRKGVWALGIHTLST
jgi:hypothetical protein